MDDMLLFLMPLKMRDIFQGFSLHTSKKL